MRVKWQDAQNEPIAARERGRPRARIDKPPGPGVDIALPISFGDAHDTGHGPRR